MGKINGSWLIAGLACLALFGGPIVSRADEDRMGMNGGIEGEPGQIGKMKERLGLSDDQATKIEELFKKIGRRISLFGTESKSTWIPFGKRWT